MEAHLIGALVATFSVLVLAYILAVREMIKIDRERHTGSISERHRH